MLAQEMPHRVEKAVYAMTTKDRLRLAACIAAAVALHFALFFGATLPGVPPVPSVIEAVLLVPAPSLNASPEAEATPRALPELDRPAAESFFEPEPPLGSEPTPPLAAEAVVQQAPPTPPVSPFAGRDVADLARAVAANATPAVERTVQGPASRVRRLGGAAPPLGADFAYYLESWRRKVERIGQLNYPREARAEGIVGSLRLLVTITPDGALDGVRVLETSGHALLDDAALRIVRLAAPYAPFSPAMRATTDLLEIERTWRFLNSRLSS